MIRQAISPRLAIRILRKRRGPFITKSQKSNVPRPRSNPFGLWPLDFGLSLFDSKERLAVLDSLTVFDIDLDDLAAGLSLNLIH